MPSTVKINGETKEIDALYLIPPDEGELNQYYGRIGNGKTYIALRDILNDLNYGLIVKCNFPIIWDGYDERKSRLKNLLKLLGLKRNFYVFPKGNLQYFDITKEWANKQGYTDFHHWFSKQTSCRIYIDEGHLVYDSYQLAKMDLDKRVAILDTRHYDRSVSIISQRASAIHAVLRGNVNRFFKCEKILDIKIPFTNKRILRFLKTEFQDIDGNEKPDETKNEDDEYEFAITQKTYWGRKKYFEKYDTRYRRGQTPESQNDLNYIDKITWKQAFKNIFKKNATDNVGDNISVRNSETN